MGLWLIWPLLGMPSSIDASAKPSVPLLTFGLRCVHCALSKLVLTRREAQLQKVEQELPIVHSELEGVGR